MIFERDIANSIWNEFSGREIVFLLGTRQTGKTTIAKILQGKWKNENSLYIDIEDRSYRNNFNASSIDTLKNVLLIEGIDVKKPGLLILDEVQLLNDPSNTLKLLHDHFINLKVVATGSSSLEIKHKFSDSLAGRKKIYLIQPLNFDEFLLFKGEEKLRRLRKLFKKEDEKSRQKLADTGTVSHYERNSSTLFDEYLIYGSYPEVVLLKNKKDKIEKIGSIVTSYIQKDIRDIARIDNIEGYNNLLKYLAINTGSEFNSANSAKTLSLQRNTIQRYVSLLTETFVIKELKPFFINKNKEISKSVKIYYKDTGVRNFQIKNFNNTEFREDAGKLHENYIFNVMDNTADILTSNYFYRTTSQTEIDFIQDKEDGLSLIEVKSGIFKNIPKAVTEFELKYKKTLKIKNKLIVNKSYFNYTKEVKFIPIFLL
ncbi:MAG: ATP-binding protein [Deltaproteobacteria bacterium]|nr:ATP-binding protein [Deltaproteobacteria bacterium]